MVCLECQPSPERSYARRKSPSPNSKPLCLAVLERVHKTGEPILVTLFGQPVARIEPPARSAKRIRLGGGAGTMEIVGDIVGPISDISDWEAAQDRGDRS